MLRARQEAGDAVDVNLLAAVYPEDASIVPDGFQLTTPLERSVLDIQKFGHERKLPFLKDLLDRAYESSDAEWVIYTNVDISLMPTFYNRVQQLLAEGSDALVINRRTISNHWSSASELEGMYEDKGESHPGYDCFVFPRSWIPTLDLGRLCIGAPYVGLALILELFVKATSLRLIDFEHLTFHLGDDQDWQGSKFLDYAYFNEKEARSLIKRLESRHGTFDQSLPSWSYYSVDDLKHRRRKIGQHPLWFRLYQKLTDLFIRPLNAIGQFRYRDFLGELGLLIRAPFIKRPDSKFIIYGSARTGTTICLSLLSTHPDLVAEHEIFNRYHAKSKKDFDKIYEAIGLSHTPPLYLRNTSIENVAAAKCRQAQRKVYCFKLLSGQMHTEDERKFVHRRIKNGWKILFVRRENLLATAISYYIAFANFDKDSAWFGAKSARTYIKPKLLITYLKRFEAEEKSQISILEGQPHLRLVYEEDYLDSDRHQAVCDRIFDYLEMPRCQVSSTMKKQGARVVSDRVANWEEVRSALEQSPFKQYLEGM